MKFNLFFSIIFVFSFCGCSSLVTRTDMKHCQSECKKDGHKFDRVFKSEGIPCCVCK